MTEYAAISALRDTLPDFAKDTRLNLGVVITPDGAPDLTLDQITLTALACAYSTGNAALIAALTSDLAPSDAIKTAAGSAATLMAMNNVYYRFVHLVHDEEIGRLPAKLRMGAMANPGVDKIDFELASLAVSAINGCGMCMESHTAVLLKHGVSRVAIQSAVRIAAVISAAAATLKLTAL